MSDSIISSIVHFIMVLIPIFFCYILLTQNPRNAFNSAGKAKKKPDEWKEPDQQFIHLLDPVSNLFNLVIKADGIVTEKEEKIVSDYFRTRLPNYFDLTDRDIRRALSVFKKTLSNNEPNSYKVYCVQILEEKFSYEARLDLLSALFQLAYAYEGIVYTELSMLRNISRFLLIKDADRVELEEKYGIKEEKEQTTYTYYSNRDEIVSNAYSMLELEKTAKKEDIKKAYRRMALIYHPDRLPSNATQADIEKAEEKFRQINEAYKCLKIENRIS